MAWGNVHAQGKGLGVPQQYPPQMQPMRPKKRPGTSAGAIRSNSAQGSWRRRRQYAQKAKQPRTQAP